MPWGSAKEGSALAVLIMGKGIPGMDEWMTGLMMRMRVFLYYVSSYVLHFLFLYLFSLELSSGSLGILCCLIFYGFFVSPPPSPVLI